MKRSARAYKLVCLTILVSLSVFLTGCLEVRRFAALVPETDSTDVEPNKRDHLGESGSQANQSTSPRRGLPNKNGVESVETAETVEGEKEPLSFSGSEFSSNYLEKCQGSEKMQLTAQLLMDFDLAHHYIKTRIGELPKLKVAVIDTGFDKGNQHEMGSTVRVEAAITPEEVKSHFSELDFKIKNLDEDREGHGVAVTSLIGGLNGVGGAPVSSELTMYKVTNAIDSGIFSMATFHGLKRACEEKNEIVNFSIIGLNDEVGLIPLHSSIQINGERVDTTELFAEFERQGCLIYRGAGNSRVSRADQEKMSRLATMLEGEDIKLDHPAVTRVEASNRFGADAGFSTSGNLRAPGQDVSTLVSKSVESSTVKMCKKNTALSDGTSFVTPLVVATASLVRSIMKLHPSYTSLEGSQVLAIEKAIMERSLYFGDINALRAVYLADLWRRQGISLYKSSLLHRWWDIVQIELAKGYCTREAQDCGSAESKISCLQEQRARLSLCIGSQKDYKNVLQTVSDLDLKEYLLIWLNRLDAFAFDRELKSIYKEKVSAFIESKALRPSEALEYYNLFGSLYPGERLTKLVDRWKTQDISRVLALEVEVDDRSLEFLSLAAKRGWLTDGHMSEMFDFYESADGIADRILYWDKLFHVIPQLIGQREVGGPRAKEFLLRFRQHAYELFSSQLTVAALRSANPTDENIQQMTDAVLEEKANARFEQKMVAVDIRILSTLSKVNMSTSDSYEIAKMIAETPRKKGYHQLSLGFLTFLKSYRSRFEKLPEPMSWVRAILRGVENTATVTYFFQFFPDLPLADDIRTEALIYGIERAGMNRQLQSVANDMLTEEILVPSSEMERAVVALRQRFEQLKSGLGDPNLDRFNSDSESQKSTEQFISSLEAMISNSSSQP